MKKILLALTGTIALTAYSIGLTAMFSESAYAYTYCHTQCWAGQCSTICS